MLDLLYLAAPIALLGAGGLFFLKGSRKKIEEIFSWIVKIPQNYSLVLDLL